MEMERPFSEKSEGKEWLIKLLKDKGFSDVVDTDVYSKKYHYDIEGYYKGQKWIFELKNRNCTSTKYRNMVFNRKQYRTLMYDIEADHKILVYFWNDCYTMVNLDNNIPGFSETIRCPKTKRFEEHQLINKDVVEWDIDTLKLYDY